MIILSLAIIFFLVEKNLQKRLNLKIKKLVLRKEIQGDSLQFRNMKLHELCEKVYEWVTGEKKDERYVFHNIGFSSGKKNTDKEFVESIEDGKKQAEIKISSTKAVIWCGAYSEMTDRIPVYYWEMEDKKSS